MDYINGLSTEVLSHILDFLEPRNWKITSQVCRRWCNILQGAHFQRQLVVRIDRSFVDPPTEQEKYAVTWCRNLWMTQWDEAVEYNWLNTYDDDDDEDEDEEENSVENFRKINVVEFKYLFQPTPEHNAAELLFSQELNLESLELRFTFAGCRYILEDRIQQLRNLTELTLYIDGAHGFKPNSVAHNVWVLHHDRIWKLRLWFTQQMINFSVITPALTCLELSSLNIFSMPIISTYASQLQRLDLKLDSRRIINDLFALQFHSVTHLYLRMDDDLEEQKQYAQLPNRQADIYLDEQFVKSMPKLKRLLFESHVLFYRMASALAKFGHAQLEHVKLDNLHFDAKQLEMLQSIPCLKIFKMRRCKALPPPETPHFLPRLHLPNLDKLSLVYNESHIVIDEGLDGLKSLKLTIATKQNHKILYKICNHLPNLENLRLCLNAKLANKAFRYLDRLTKLRTIRVDNVELNEQLWQHCPEMASVRKLMFTNGKLTMDTLTAIARLFPALDELYCKECYFQNCDKEINGGGEGEGDSIGDDDDFSNVQYVERVRKCFPKSRVSFNHSAFLKSNYK